MFSNLQTEGGQWNHFILPRAMRFFHFQDDLVYIVESDDPELARGATERRGYTPFALRALAAGKPSIGVTYEFRGQRRQAARLGEDALLGAPLNPLLGKVFWFRDVPAPAYNVCGH
jgi:hypothetical protein